MLEWRRAVPESEHTHSTLINLNNICICISPFVVVREKINLLIAFVSHKLSNIFFEAVSACILKRIILKVSGGMDESWNGESSR